MTKQSIFKIFRIFCFLAGSGIILGSGAVDLGLSVAMAQVIDCTAYRAELESISREADPRAQEYLVAAQRQRAELERTREYYDQIGCTRTDLYQMPAECASLRGHMRQMQINMNEMLAFSDKLGGGPQSQARRRQLQALLDRHCANVPAPQRGLLDRLFGGSRASHEVTLPGSDQADVRGEVVEGQALGGSQPVCVRVADGYFFPLGGRFSDRIQASRLCQAQCPASQTELFFMRQGGAIETAMNANGLPYSALPGARLYQTQRVAEVSCLPAGQNWGQAMQGAEGLIARHESDIIVTSAKADELSRPKTSAYKAKAASKKSVAVDRLSNHADESIDPGFVPTAGGESAGIGPDVISDGRTISTKDGLNVTSVAADGSQRHVRIVAPYLIPAPKIAPSQKR